MTQVLHLYECPKCRTLRYEKAYYKHGKYFSTCNYCRVESKQEEHFSNFSIQRLAISLNKPYCSHNHKESEPLNGDFPKAQLLNALTSRVIRQYNSLPATPEVNAYLLLLLKNLVSVETYGKSLGEVKNFLDKKPNFSKLNTYKTEDVFDIQMHRLFDKECLIGEETEILTYHFYLIPIKPEKSIKDIRKRYEHRRRRYFNQLWNNRPHECYICGELLEQEDAVIDHIVPVVRGGKNNIDNLALACDFCNNIKDSHVLHEISDYVQPLKAVTKKEIELVEQNKTYIQEMRKCNSNNHFDECMKNAILHMYTNNLERLESLQEYRSILKRKAELERFIK